MTGEFRKLGAVSKRGTMGFRESKENEAEYRPGFTLDDLLGVPLHEMLSKPVALAGITLPKSKSAFELLGESVWAHSALDALGRSSGHSVLETLGLMRNDLLGGINALDMGVGALDHLKGKSSLSDLIGLSEWRAEGSLTSLMATSILDGTRSDRLMPLVDATDYLATGLAKSALSTDWARPRDLEGIARSRIKERSIAATLPEELTDPLAEYLKNDPFKDLLDQAHDWGIDELGDEEKAASEQILEAHPEIASAVSESAGYSKLSPGQRVLVMGMVSITVWLMVAFGVLYVQTEFPWTEALLEDLGLTPTEAANKASGVVAGVGTLNELVQAKQSKPDAGTEPGN
ncbi:hypothetical protein [Paeniglutamicibacter sp. NPDC091659]|uniref:hypothetical protein n=1 Tax=Paeniglutamicibacter sp. NPDC091659 TaxID=3364389 RepID=UPI0037FE13C8